LLPDSTFRISVPQIVDLGFCASKNTASRDLKRLLGAAFCASKVQIGTDRSLIVNALTIPEFEQLLTRLAFAGNELARDWVMASVGLTFTQLAHDAHNIRYESAERTKYIADREQSKLTRRSLTDRLKVAGFESNDPTIYGRITMKCYHKLGLYELYAEWKGSGNKKPFRDTLSQLDLLRLERLEDWVVRKYSQEYQPDAAISMF
jgi:hypothetical protein